MICTGLRVCETHNFINNFNVYMSQLVSDGVNKTIFRRREDGNKICKILGNSLELFGADAAEDDHYLGDYFVETPNWNSVINGNVLLVLGRKGSGKSAIVSMLKRNPPENTLILPIIPASFSLNALTHFINESDASPFNEERAYIAAWKYSILLELLIAIEKNTKNPIPFFGDNGLSHWIQEHAEFATDIIEKTISFLKKWRIESINVVGIQASRSSMAQEIDGKMNYINAALSAKNYIICIDNLDEGWVNRSGSRAYLVGLIIAARELSQLHRNLNITIFMRTDMYAALEGSYQHLDKFRQSISTISWNATSLQRLVAKRIQRFFKVTSESSEASWGRIFPDKMRNGFYTYRHLVERTFLRPREILQLSRLCVDVAHQYKKNRVEERDINSAAIQYATWKINDLSGEYSAYYNNVAKLINFFRIERPYLSREEILFILQNAINDINFTRVEDGSKVNADEVLQFLYSSGFIRATHKKGCQWKYITSATDPDLLCHTIKNWDIHPAFRPKIVFRH